MLHRENQVYAPHTTSAADLVKETMDYYHITQKDLADRIGVSQKTISKILNRKSYMNEVEALRIEKVMGISSQLLLNLDSQYRLEKAKDTVTDNVQFTPRFLQRYDWVTA